MRKRRFNAKKKEVYRYDVHGMRLWEAELDIPDEIEQAYLLGYQSVKIIHGYRHGFALGHYIRNKLQKHVVKFTDIPYVLIDFHEPGATIVRFIRNN